MERPALPRRQPPRARPPSEETGGEVSRAHRSRSAPDPFLQTLTNSQGVLLTFAGLPTRPFGIHFGLLYVSFRPGRLRFTLPCVEFICLRSGAPQSPNAAPPSACACGRRNHQANDYECHDDGDDDPYQLARILVIYLFPLASAAPEGHSAASESSPPGAQPPIRRPL